MTTTAPAELRLYDYDVDDPAKEVVKDAADWAAGWGCDPTYDKLPRLPGDGYLFYNYGVEGGDPDFLAKFIPAIERTIAEVRERLRKAGDDLSPADDRQYDRDIVNLEALKQHCERMRAKALET